MRIQATIAVPLPEGPVPHQLVDIVKGRIHHAVEQEMGCGVENPAIVVFRPCEHAQDVRCSRRESSSNILVLYANGILDRLIGEESDVHAKTALTAARDNFEAHLKECVPCLTRVNIIRAKQSGGEVRFFTKTVQ